MTSVAFALLLRAAVLDMDAICASLEPGQHVDIRGNRFERGDGGKCSAKNLRAAEPRPGLGPETGEEGRP